MQTDDRSRSTAASAILHRNLLSVYLREFASYKTDPLCPELHGYNTTRFSDFWQLCLDQGQKEVPFWAVVWPGSRALARFILDHKELFENQRVLDLGAGNGVASLAAAMVGAQVLAVDISPEALLLARKSARQQRLQIALDCSDFLDWPQSAFSGFDRILMGDLFYEQPLAAECEALLRSLADRKIWHVAADALRNHRPTQRLGTLATYCVPVLKEMENTSYRTVNLIQLQV